MLIFDRISNWLNLASKRRRGLFGAFIFMNLGIFALAIAIGIILRPLLDPSADDSLHSLAIGLLLFAFFVQIYIVLVGRRSDVARETLFREARAEREKTNELFAMTDMLQSADGYDDACAVLRATSLRLLPGYSAALYVFNNSRDRLDLAGSWNLPDDHHFSEALAPTNCWALKRGKFHINDEHSATLRCSHHTGALSTIEIPMMARGSVYGLLILGLDHSEAFDRLYSIQRLARALADSMSLALSNISLREKLRTQSLRDPLTGLYNRRYMEDALERYVSLSERTGSPTSLIMVDLDHFKSLNDEHGHAKGDAVLRDVGAQLVGGLRPSDVVCRYGGEELVVLLPNCGLEDARLRAEILRSRIEGLSEAHGAKVTASFGVATIPETSSSNADILPMADAALYQAKKNGRNCVVCAEKRGGREDRQPRLAATG